jgi:hypothetical protein
MTAQEKVMSANDLARNIRKGETLFVLGLLVLVGVLFADSLGAPPRPMLLPKTVQFILLVLLSIQFFKLLLTKTVEKEKTEEERIAARKVKRKMIISFIGMLAVPFASYLIGFILSGCLYVLLTILFWGGSKVSHIIIAEVFLVGLMYGIFTMILDISFPVGILFGG